MMNEATARGFGTIGRFLDAALIAADLQEQHMIDGTARAKTDRLWRHL
jgi:hypothetical protein